MSILRYAGIVRALAVLFAFAATGFAGNEGVAAYDVVIVAGQQLKTEVREVGTGNLLTPSDEYAPHSLTASGVLFVRCREGYDMTSGTITPSNVGLCVAGTCGVPTDPQEVVTVKMRCVKTSDKD